MNSKKKELNSLTLEELEDFLVTYNFKGFRSKQVYNYIHKNNGQSISKITTLSENDRKKLNEIGYINNITIYKKFESKLDETIKYLFLLKDGNIIETVLMKYKHGLSVCISTQVGCRMGCKFCASTQDGLVRNLTSGEMLSQIYEIENDTGKKISNIVLMGSGEPLDNYENVIRFIKIISSKEGKNLSLRNITLSTCGIVPKIYRLADEELPITLAISLHASNDSQREKIMPIAKRYSIKEILKACEYYFSKTRRRITIEYTLIEGVNDRLEDAENLFKLLNNLNVHLNLIPLNKIEEYNETNTKELGISKFKNLLKRNNINVTVRREMGSDISASCGQLRRSIL